MLVIQCYIFFGPPPTSPDAAAINALVAYFVFAVIALWPDRQSKYVAANQQ